MKIPQTANGYDLRSIGDWRNYWDDKFKKKFGDDADMSDDQILGMLSAILAEGTLDLDSLAFAIRNGLLPQFATDKPLDDVCGSVGISRHPASNSYVTLEITGYYDPDDPTTIESGEQFATPDNHVFTTMGQAVISNVTQVADANGNQTQLTDPDGNPMGIVYVQAYSEETGTEPNVVANSIVNPISSIDGFYSVTNPQGATGGEDEETDDHLRARYFFQNTAYAPGSRNSIESQILNISGVQDCRLIDNKDPQNNDKYGNPPLSVHLYVVGGDSQTIAQTLQNQLYVCTRTMGQVPEITHDVNGQKTPTNFDRAQTTTVYVNVDLDVDNQVFNLDDGPAQIKQAIINYFSTFKMGSKVMNNRLYTLVFSDGVIDATITTGTDKNNLSTADIVPEDFNLPQVSADTVTVNIKDGE